MALIRRSRAGGFIRGGKARRESFWIGWVFTDTALAALNTAAITNSLTAVGLALRPFTIVRTRMQLYIRSDQEAASESQFGAWGFCVVTDQAFSIGVTAVPTPVTDMDSDSWLAHQWLMSSHGAGTVDSQKGQPYEVDSKAMRKVEDGFQPLPLVENGSGAGGIVISAAGRFLIKLH